MCTPSTVSSTAGDREEVLDVCVCVCVAGGGGHGGGCVCVPAGTAYRYSGLR